MKLATRKNNTRDGELLVVSRDGAWAVSARSVAPTMQAALDDWSDCEPQLQGLYDDLCAGAASDSFRFSPSQCAAPLPRAYQWADGSAYVHHVELVRKARGADMPESFWTDPLMYQGGSDGFLGPRDSIVQLDDGYGLDMEAEIAVITADVPMGVDENTALSSIKLLMLVNDVSLRGLMPSELAKGFGFYQSKPATAFSPLAITPDELGDHWRDGKVHRPLQTWLNGDQIGAPDAGEDMVFNFPQLIVHAAKTRTLVAGSIIGSGTVSNRDPAKGSSCLVEKRMLETLVDGQPTTRFLTHGDQVKIEMLDQDGQSYFGAIDQQVITRG